MHKAARNRGNEVSCPRESVQNDAVDKPAVAAKHWGTPITWTVCAEWARIQNYHRKISLRSFKMSGYLWIVGAEPWECRTASLWDDESKAPSQVLSRAGSSNPLWTCLFACSWQSPLPSPAQHRILGGTALPQPCRRSSHRHQSRASTSRGRWGQEMGENTWLLLYLLHRFEQPPITITSLPKTRQTLKRSPPKGWISEGGLEMSISAWWAQDTPTVALQGLQEAELVFITICRNEICISCKKLLCLNGTAEEK